FFEAINDIQADQIKGIIAIGKFTSKQVKKLHGISPNLVFVDQSPNEDKYDSVVVNLERATKKILDYFIANNHVQIGFIGGKENIREKAFSEKLKEENLLDCRFSYVGAFSVDEGYRLMKEAIEEHGGNLPTAFVISSDVMAIGSLRALHEYGIAFLASVSIMCIIYISISRSLYTLVSTFI